MLRLFGLKSNTNIEVRERFSFSLKRQKEGLNKLSSIFKEVVILSTCNRTEIYFTSDMEKEEAMEYIFDLLQWDKALMKHTFIVEEEKVIKHIMKVACGFHSKILGEDQILGQVKSAYSMAREVGTIHTELLKLFEYAISCGKEFRTTCKLHEIPVSASSIAVKDSIQRQVENYMVIGYGEMGKLAIKYILDSKYVNALYIVTRNVEGVKKEIDAPSSTTIKILSYEEKKAYYQKVEGIISCTGSPHIVVKAQEFENMDLKKPLYIYDIALPRDVDKNVKKVQNITLYDIDDLSNIDEVNKEKRKEIMYANRDIIDKYMQNFMEWQSIREISPYIVKLKENSKRIYEGRYETFINKKESNSPEKLVRTLLKSVSDAYVNRSIELLKEEKLKGREKECLRMLEKIFGI